MAAQLKIGTSTYEVVRYNTCVVRAHRNGLPSADAGCTGLQVTVIPAAADLLLYEWYITQSVRTGTIRLDLPQSTRTVTFTRATLSRISEVYDAIAADSRRLQLLMTIVPDTVTVADKTFRSASPDIVR